ncbi:Aminotriazole resistance [Hyphodiscus hymeniophilus]|uniref:Aminotriazole resistance n=1 Tax=Hyphodiscus hymeniophilus TaxID=353542 RepID=A0A9P6VRX5_9HELO|nr:Aminotriazole resistance [Hyphodiscus hymeniophilus]
MSELLTIISIESVPLHALHNDASPASPPPPINPPHVTSENGLQVTLESQDRSLRQGRIIIIIAVLTGVNFLASLCNGFITIGLPQMASDLSLAEGLLIWPSAVYFLTSSACLLVAGSVADVIGNRRVNLTGCFLVGVFILGCGFARTGIELIMFRAMQGVAVSLCLPTSVAIVATSIPSGRRRNIGFSCLGFIQPIGFSLGMVLEGVIADTVGWRFSYYLTGSLSLAFFALSLWALPRDGVVEGSVLVKLQKDIDWVGAIMASTSLGVFSYVLATLTSTVTNIRQPASISLLVLSIALVPAFIKWEHRRERSNLPQLIPNSLWRNPVFTSVCLTVLFSNAVANAMEIFCSLLYDSYPTPSIAHLLTSSVSFQEVQKTSALGASLRILPSLLVAFFVQLTTGLIVHRTTPYLLILASLCLSAGAPLIMALTSPHWPYWYAAFPAQLLAPVACDIMFTIGLLAVSEEFPAHTQAMAGAVFSTVAQFGTSIGLTAIAVVAAAVTNSKVHKEKERSEELLAGYRAGFWTQFALMGLACLIGTFGLRKIGRIGLKRD